MSNTISDPVATAPAVADEPVVRSLAARRALAVLRIMFGFYFLWAFLDKTLGLGYATPAERAWISGGSPTKGFLGGVEGPFAGPFNAIAGNGFIDLLFMVGLLGIGLALTLGIGMRIAAISGAVMYLLMFLAVLPLVTNPLIDDHITGAMTVIVLALTGSGSTWGLGRRWAELPLVKKNTWLI